MNSKIFGNNILKVCTSSDLYRKVVNEIKWKMHKMSEQNVLAMDADLENNFWLQEKMYKSSAKFKWPNRHKLKEITANSYQIGLS